MEVRYNTRSKGAAYAERCVVIVKTWVELGKPPVNAGLLRTIHSRLIEAFGNIEVAGPAAIARVLADEGAELKHPEIIETDAEWRESRIETNASDAGFERLASS